ncbi:RHS repeat-associated core domain-containing protein [Pseudomonas frederiksbergensis]|uniref:RHS repeat-associated core domain-containing protein n=1 Tax=Pseudomonas frederiksbergensis TaxID=104087 RepID=UPI0021824AD7|nr:RHS repeat-associated core domain-containing protein [Pseudomonas frederiksbergensis]
MTQVQENPNQQRVVLLATTSSQSIIAEIVDGKTNAIGYTAYGEQSAQQEVVTQLGFNGQLREAKIGWYLLGNGYRAYNPRLMRFHSPDSLSPFGEGGLNAYMYCGGEPVMNSDPTGHSIWALSRGIVQLTERVGAVATRVVNKTATSISSGVSQVLGAVQSAKKAFADNLLFDPDVIKKLGPPPPKVIHKLPPNHVFHPNRYPPFPSKKNNPGEQLKLGASTSESPPVRGNNSSRPPVFNQPYEPRRSISDTHTKIRTKEDNLVTIIRRES